MACAKAKLTVLFDDPFWVALYERQEERRYEVCKITFGAEPKDYEVYAYLLANWQALRFSPVLRVGAPVERRMNPKRMQREVRREVGGQAAIGTRAQQALKLQQEAGKLERKAKSREQKEAEAERCFQLRQEKRKAKHRGH